jgi:hypothetical protein
MKKTLTTGQSNIVELASRIEKEMNYASGLVTPISGYGLTKAVKIKYWGSNNLEPYEREQIIFNSHLLGRLIKTLRNIVLGENLILIEKSIDAEGNTVKKQIPLPGSVAMIFKNSDMPRQLMNACDDLLKHANIGYSFVRTKGGDIYSLKAVKFRHIRAGDQNEDGEIDDYYFCGNWAQPHSIRFPVSRLVSYAPLSKQSSFMLHIKDELLTDEYYGVPQWWGARRFATLANSIPEFHLKDLENGASPSFHIKKPKDYCDDTDAYNNAITEEQKKSVRSEDEARSQKFIDDVTNSLNGIGNTGNIAVTEYDVDPATGKMVGDIIIEPISRDLHGDEFIKVLQEMSLAIVSAVGLHPALAGVMVQGKMTNSTEILRAYQLCLLIEAPQYRRLLFGFEKVFKDEGLLKDNQFFDVEAQTMVTLAGDPTGVADVNDNAV